MPPYSSNVSVSPTGRYQVGAPAHPWEAVDERSRITKTTRKTRPRSTCLRKGALLQFESSFVTVVGHR